MANQSLEERAQHRIDAIRQASLQGPALQPSPPIQSPVTPTFAFFFGKLKPTDRIRCVREIRKAVATDWMTKHDSAMDAIGLQKPPPRERLLIYQGGFDDAHWAELASKFPHRHAELWNDYVDLQQKAATGKLN